MRFSSSRGASKTCLALGVLALSLSACAARTHKGDTPYVARDVGSLYTAAKRRLTNGRYAAAAELFDEVERQHPYSVWARRAQLMGAYSYYRGHDYTKAIESAQRFLSIHPGNRDAPYAYYLVALSYYEQITDVTRDQKITTQAQDALGELIRRYPDTKYAADARVKMDLVRDHLAGKEMEIGRFYETRGLWLAATLRFRHVIDDYQTTTHTPEALMRLTETYLALGVPEQANQSAAVLGANYPATDWYKRAYTLMQKHPNQGGTLIAPGEQIIPAAVAAGQKPALPGTGSTKRGGAGALEKPPADPGQDATPGT